ncbi:PKD domain-containing protein [Blastococcus sp. SYSU DS0828]
MRASSAAAPKRILAGLVSLALTAGVFALLPVATATADSAPLGPANPATPTTVSADALPTVQINGVAWAQAVVGDTVYVGGSFTTARPAGAPEGTQEVTRDNLLAYDIRTGELIASFAHTLNGQVLAVAASPDGSRLYVGGDFTEVDGQVRRRVAAFDTRSGELVPTWRPSINSQVRAIAATNDTVYLGGSITAVGGVSRSRLAAVTAADGALLPWAPLPGVGSTAGNRNGNRSTSDQVMALVITGNGTQVVAGGRFDSMNGVKATGVTALDPVTGETRPFAINQKLTNQGINSAVYSLSTDGTTVYGTAYDYHGPGNLEGSFAATADGGAIITINDCRGDSYSSYPMNGALYVASHAHDCQNIGGFPEQDPRVHRFGVAFSLAPTGVTGSHTLANSNLRNQPAGSLLPWFPTMTPGTYTGQYQAGWSVAGNGQYVVYGGEFPRVNGVDQQGLVRYALPGSAPNQVGPSADGFTATATAASPVPGQATISWQATSDQDNAALTYSVHREGEQAPVAELVQSSTWWNRPAMSASDVGVSGSLRYRVTATDPFGNSVSTDWVAVEVAPATGGQSRPYAETVLADGATSHWRLGESSGTTAADAIGSSPMTVGSGVTKGQVGALADGDTAYAFDGTANATLATRTAAAVPNTFTQEAWFQTTSTRGGRIIGFANARTGNSSTYDRQVYLDNRGRVNFGVSVPLFWTFTTQRTVTSTASFNDGAWHHVAATMGRGGMALYVDGVLVGSRTDTTSGLAYNGYLRVGSDRAMGGASTFTGRVDEVALYPTALSAAQVSAHAVAGGVGTPANVPPGARFDAVSDELAVAVDAARSHDSDGSIVSWAWTFGDGATATGATATHGYAAAGTYPVTLTVTDDRGATSTSSRLVTVALPVPNEAPTASFTAVASGLTVGLDASASADADGSLTSYAWDFGDGSTGAGRTVSHAYGAAGTYLVTLTVTDDRGATATARREVEVTAPAVPVPLARDTFERSVSGGLGAAEVGGDWTASAGASRLSVSGGAADLALPGAGNNTGAFLGSVSQTGADVTTSFSLSSTPTGAGTYLYITGRRVGSGEEYRVRVRVTAEGRVGLALSRLTGGAESFPGGEVMVPGLTWTPGSALNVRVRVSGTGTTEVTAAVWAETEQEPVEPQLVRTDSTEALQDAGSVGLTAHRPGSSTAATTVRIPEFTAMSIGAVVPQPPVEEPPAEEPPTEEPPTEEPPVEEPPVDEPPVEEPPTEEPPVEEPPAADPAVLAEDSFERSVSGGLGAAEVGGEWSASAGASRLSVSGGAAELALPGAGNNTGAFLGSVSQTGVDVATSFTLSSAPTGAGTYLYVTGRRVGSGEEYRVRVRVTAEGRVGLALSRLTGGSESFPGGELLVPGLTWTPGATVNVRVRVSGSGTTEVTASVWAEGTPEPEQPQLVRTDSTEALQAPGSVGLTAHRPGSSTAATVVRIPALRVTALA